PVRVREVDGERVALLRDRRADPDVGRAVAVVVEDRLAVVDAVRPAPHALPRLALGAVEDLLHRAGDGLRPVLVEERQEPARTDSTAHGIAPTWIGTCSACATSRALASQIAVEKSRLEFRICEYAVRSIASPISCTIASKRWVRTETVTGSSMARQV